MPWRSALGCGVRSLRGCYSVDADRWNAIDLRLLRAHTDTMRRALACLKYVPALLCGLLVVAWVVSITTTFALAFPGGDGGAWVFGCTYGSVKLCFSGRLEPQYQFMTFENGTDEEVGWFGSFRPQVVPLVDREISCPLPFLLTALAPLAVGSLTRFRFSLWPYFAWTALVAAELAYYLRA